MTEASLQYGSEYRRREHRHMKKGKLKARNINAFESWLENMQKPGSVRFNNKQLRKSIAEHYGLYINSEFVMMCWAFYAGVEKGRHYANRREH